MFGAEVSPAKIEVYAARTSEIPSVKYPAPALAACIVRMDIRTEPESEEAIILYAARAN